MSSQDIRQTCLDFFKDRGQCIMPSASLNPHNDPSLMFTTAGMVPFKNVFMGTQERPCPTAASCQKCVRAGGKHNDLEQVGYTQRHHTFFEMMGNFSFGDYFKEQAIVYAWELLTQVFKLPADRLWVTVYHTDDQAFDLWKKVARLDDSRILRIATDDNFWSAGDTGPCGPCSEIFYDHGSHLEGGLPGTPTQEGDRYVELWNMVFIQYNQVDAHHREDLPALSIDTGMGLERIAAVLQGVSDNFDTDLFKPLIAQSRSQVDSHRSEASFSHRVIADHVRSASFLIADGVMPSNEGRGYVLRRIMRRAMRHVHRLGGAISHLANVSHVLVETMRAAYPELIQAQHLIASILCEESRRFEDLLKKGLVMLDQWTAQGSDRTSFSGDKAFELYDTYGFPLDLTQDLLKERGVSVDEKGFQKCMDQQKERSRATWVGSREQEKDDLWVRMNDSLPPTQFDGYQENQGEGIVQKMIYEGQEVETLRHGQVGWMISSATPFYGESGGQMGDRGTVSAPHGTARVLDTKKRDNLIVHHIQVGDQSSITAGETVTLSIDVPYRRSLMAHHSATHLLQAALRGVLGSHVVQKGSKVSDDKLRFDLSHSKALTPEEVNQVEHAINTWIQNNALVTDCIMPKKEALQDGAMAFFGEKYGDTVRVVTMGGTPSKELCGGTHVQRTGDLGLFKIISQSSVAAGIRRIEAVAGMAAVAFVKNLSQQMDRVAATLKTSPLQVEQAIDQMLSQKHQKDAKSASSSAEYTKESIGTLPLWHAHCPDATTKDLKKQIDRIKPRIQSGLVLLTCPAGKAVSFVLGVTDDLVQSHSANDLLRALWDGQGAGGGRAALAQGHSPALTNHDQVVEHLKRVLSN